MNRAKGTGTAKVTFVDQPARLRPDMAARVSFLAKALDEKEMKAPPKKIVPGSALADRGGAKAVFVVDGGKVRQTTVSLGAPFGSGFEIVDGPPPGTRV